MTLTETIALCLWSCVAGVAGTLLVLRLREKRRAERAQRAFMEMVTAYNQPPVRMVGGPLDNEHSIFMPSHTRAMFAITPESCACYRREPGASTARFVAVLPFEEAKAWAQREGNTQEKP